MVEVLRGAGDAGGDAAKGDVRADVEHDQAQRAENHGEVERGLDDLEVAPSE